MITTLSPPRFSDDQDLMFHERQYKIMKSIKIMTKKYNLYISAYKFINGYIIKLNNINFYQLAK